MEASKIKSVAPAKVTNINDMPRKMAEAFSVPVSTLLADDVIETEWLLPGLFPRPSVVLFSGEPGGGKSFLAYDLLRAVATGTPWMGRGPICPAGPQPAVLLNYDNPTEEVKIRLRKLGVPKEAPIHVHTLGYTRPTQSNVPAILQIPEQESRLLYMLKYLKPSLILFDSFRQGQTLDENSSKDMSVVMGILKKWSQINQTCVVALHHTGKGSSTKQEWKSSARGSGEIIGSSDVVCEIDPGKITWTKTRAWKIDKKANSATFELADTHIDILPTKTSSSEDQVIKMVHRVNVNATSALPGEAEAAAVKQLVEAISKSSSKVVTYKELMTLALKKDVLRIALQDARSSRQLEYVQTPAGKGYRLVTPELL